MAPPVNYLMSCRDLSPVDLKPLKSLPELSKVLPEQRKMAEDFYARVQSFLWMDANGNPDEVLQPEEINFVFDAAGQVQNDKINSCTLLAEAREASTKARDPRFKESLVKRVEPEEKNPILHLLAKALGALFGLFLLSKIFRWIRPPRPPGGGTGTGSTTIKPLRSSSVVPLKSRPPSGEGTAVKAEPTPMAVRVASKDLAGWIQQNYGKSAANGAPVSPSDVPLGSLPLGNPGPYLGTIPLLTPAPLTLPPGWTPVPVRPILIPVAR